MRYGRRLIPCTATLWVRGDAPERPFNVWQLSTMSRIGRPATRRYTTRPVQLPLSDAHRSLLPPLLLRAAPSQHHGHCPHHNSQIFGE